MKGKVNYWATRENQQGLLWGGGWGQGQGQTGHVSHWESWDQKPDLLV